MTVVGKDGPASFITKCFGLCLPSKYTAVPTREPLEHKCAPKRPSTKWRDIPLLANYELIKQIGKGGFAEIWLATCKSNGGTVALKVVQLANEELEPEDLSTLLSESKFLRSLDCPYLLRCSHGAATEEWMVMVLEYLAGGEMLDHIHKVQNYTEAEAGKLFAQIVSAVSYLHNLNIMHRDIKPENVMFVSPVEQCEAEGRPLRVKLIDLGMAAMYDEKKPIHGCVGTPGFVAPELWNNGPHTPAADIYSLGVVLFVMLTGRKPHSGYDIRTMEYCNKSIQEAPGLKDERFLSLSPSARELLLSMLADDPFDRPTALAVLRHPFITAVDSNREAHREMGEQVRRRMRDLNRIRRMHGLRYAMAMSKPSGADQVTYLQMLDKRRLQLKKRLDAFGRLSSDVMATADDVALPPHFPRNSLAIYYSTPPDVIALPARTTTTTTTTATGAFMTHTTTIPPHSPLLPATNTSTTTPSLSTPNDLLTPTANNGCVTTTTTVPTARCSNGIPTGCAVVNIAATATPTVVAPMAINQTPHYPDTLLPGTAFASSIQLTSCVKPAADGCAATKGVPPQGPTDLTDLDNIPVVSEAPTVPKNRQAEGPMGQCSSPETSIAAATAAAAAGDGSSGRKRAGSGPGTDGIGFVGLLPAVLTSNPNHLNHHGGMGIGSGGADHGDDTRTKLPGLQTCMSANFLGFTDLVLDEEEGGEEGGGRRVGGGSPVASRMLVERALLNKCLSMHPDTLEFLSQQEALKRAQDASGEEREPGRAVGGPTATGPIM